MLMVGSFPFNSFLAGVFSCLGFFTLTGECALPPHLPPSLPCRPRIPPRCQSPPAPLPLTRLPPPLALLHITNRIENGTVCLRMQVDPSNAVEFRHVSPERAFADWALANLLLQLVVWNYIG